MRHIVARHVSVSTAVAHSKYGRPFRSGLVSRPPAIIEKRIPSNLRFALHMLGAYQRFCKGEFLPSAMVRLLMQ